MESQTTIIRAERRTGLHWREIWEFRELFRVFVARSFQLRYKQTALGVAWAVLQPLATVALLSLVLGAWIGVPSDGLPYPLFALAAIVPWQYFSRTVSQASASVLEHRAIVCKVYFPRILLPLAAAVSGLLDLAIAVVAVAGVMLACGVTPPASTVLLPGFVLLILGVALAAGVWIAAFSARFHDFQLLLPYLLHAWFFASPVVYPASLVPAEWRSLYNLNPMVPAIEGFRAALLGRPIEWGPHSWIPLAAAALLLLAGAAFFRRVEGTFADLV